MKNFSEKNKQIALLVFCVLVTVTVVFNTVASHLHRKEMKDALDGIRYSVSSLSSGLGGSSSSGVDLWEIERVIERETSSLARSVHEQLDEIESRLYTMHRALLFR